VPVDLKDGSYGGRIKPSTETLLHVAIYRRRPDVAAIVHTHSPYAAVFAVNRLELPPVLEEMAQLVGGCVKVAPYAAPGSIKLAEGAAATLQGGAAVLLANHGLVGVGHTLREALTVCQVVERSAQVFLWARLSGTPYLLGEQDIKELRQGFLQNYGQKPRERG
jgi:L-fuculose-phosphate aldolase